jgi:hypothetical protein
MSNVLIGIIGVILFIGLALAGALILGDDFKTSKSTTEAAAIMQQMAQVSAGYDMYRLKLGRPPVVTTGFAHERGRLMIDAMIPRFIKSQPVTIRAAGGSNWFFVDETGAYSDKPTLLMYNVVADGGPAKDLCDAIAQQSGMADAAGKAPTLPKPPLDRQQGCYSFEGPWGFDKGLTGNYHIFRRI